MDQVAVDALTAPGEGTSRADAFRGLADRHLDACYRLARAILHDDADAEDATHDAFVAAWRNWSTLRDPARFERWFQRILVNTCRNRLRRSARLRVVDISVVPAAADGAADEAARTDDREMLRRAIGQLPPDDRVVLALRYHGDLTVDEIAEHLGIRPGTVKSRLHYALRRLHAVLDPGDAREVLR